MHVFVTGATGWVGSAVVQELINAGHPVTGLVRSDEKAATLAATGARALRATLDDLDVLRQAAGAADAVIHTAFNHDFSRFIESCEQDRRVIEALGSALAGSDRPLLVTTGLSGLPRGATEYDRASPAAPRQSEAAVRALTDRGVRAALVRLASSVHGLGDHGFVALLVRLAREKGISAWLDNGQNCWSGVPRLDAARVYRLALEQGVTEPVYHAVADEAVPFRLIAAAIGRQLGLPAGRREPQHFGWFAGMVGMEMAASSTHTRAILGWKPEGPSLLTELDDPAYYAG